MKGKHLVMLAGENLVANLKDQLVSRVIEPLSGVVGGGSRLFERRIGRDHLARNQIVPDAEMLERALGLCAP